MDIKYDHIMDYFSHPTKGLSSLLSHLNFYSISITAFFVLAAFILSKTIPKSYIKKTPKISKEDPSVLCHKINHERIHSETIQELKITDKVQKEFDHPLGKITFTYLYSENLANKSNLPGAKSSKDPFKKPFPPGVFIEEITESHNLLFNKFCVSKNHVLITTKDFEDQSNPASSAELGACFKVLKALDGFCFYNSAQLAGASQRHKHMQVMPYDRNLHKYDIFGLIDKEAMSKRAGEPFKSTIFRFKHRVARLPKFENLHDYDEIGKTLEEVYNALLKDMNMVVSKRVHYNLLMTDKWMWLIKRTKESALDEVSMNSLAFLGTFLFKKREQLDRFLKEDPFKILEELSEVEK